MRLSLKIKLVFSKALSKRSAKAAQTDSHNLSLQSVTMSLHTQLFTDTDNFQYIVMSAVIQFLVRTGPLNHNPSDIQKLGTIFCWRCVCSTDSRGIACPPAHLTNKRLRKEFTLEASAHLFPSQISYINLLPSPEADLRGGIPPPRRRGGGAAAHPVVEGRKEKRRERKGKGGKREEGSDSR